MKRIFIPLVMLVAIAMVLAAVGLIAEDHGDKDKFQLNPKLWYSVAACTRALPGR